MTGRGPLRLLQVRPAGIPRFWRVLRPDPTPSESRAALRELVCTAMRIPYRPPGKDGRLYVPALFEHYANRELAEAAAEGFVKVRPEPVRHNAHLALLVLLGLLFAHGLRMGWWGGLSVADRLAHAGRVDVGAVLAGDWQRCFTALTLHADSEHLFGNLLFGAPFLILLFRRAGAGPGVLLTLLSGGLGNLFMVLYRHDMPWRLSLGFSTALFGTVGALAALMALRNPQSVTGQPRRGRWRQSGVVLAAGLAILAMLGTEGERVDYAAHIWGLVAGMLCGGLYGWLYSWLCARQRRALLAIVEKAAGPAALLLLAGAWWLALW